MAKAVLTDEQIEAIRAKQEDIVALETAMGTAVFRAPTRDEYLRSLKMQQSEREAIHAPRWLACECVVHPDRVTFEQWIAKRPGLPKAADGPLTRLCGLDIDAPAVLSEDEDTVSVNTVLGAAVFKCPDERQFNEYRKRAGGKDPQGAFEFLALACAVSPSRETLGDWLQRKPGIAATVAPHIQRLAGLEEQERVKG